MKSSIPVSIIVLLILSGGVATKVAAQCTQKIKVSSIHTKNTTGEFNVSIQQAGAFSGKLIKVEGTQQRVVQSFSSPGSKDISFTNLNLDADFYRVVIDFNAEQKFQCKSKTVDVDFTDRK